MKDTIQDFIIGQIANEESSHSQFVKQLKSTKKTPVITKIASLLMPNTNTANLMLNALSRKTRQ